MMSNWTWPPRSPGQILADVPHDAGLVGATGAATGQHESYPWTVAASSGSRRRAHPSRSRLCVPRKRASSIQRRSEDRDPLRRLAGRDRTGGRAMKRTEWLRDPRIWSLAAARRDPAGLHGADDCVLPAGGACRFSLNRIGGTDDWRHFRDAVGGRARRAERLPPISVLEPVPLRRARSLSGAGVAVPGAAVPADVLLAADGGRHEGLDLRPSAGGTLGARALVADEGGGAARAAAGRGGDGGLRLLRRAHRRRSPVVHAVPLPAGHPVGVSAGAGCAAGGFRYAVVAAALLAATVLEGGTYPAPLMAVALAAESLARLGRRDDRRAMARALPVILLLCVLLAAVRLLPALAFLREHPRLEPHRRLLALGEVFAFWTTRTHGRADGRTRLRLARVRRLRGVRPGRADAGGRCWSPSLRGDGAGGACGASIWPSSSCWSGARWAESRRRRWPCCCTRCRSSIRCASPRGSSVRRWSAFGLAGGGRARARGRRWAGGALAVGGDWRRRRRVLIALGVAADRDLPHQSAGHPAGARSAAAATARPAPTSSRTRRPATGGCRPSPSRASGRARATWRWSGSRRPWLVGWDATRRRSFSLRPPARVDADRLVAEPARIRRPPEAPAIVVVNQNYETGWRAQDGERRRADGRGVVGALRAR